MYMWIEYYIVTINYSSRSITENKIGKPLYIYVTLLKVYNIFFYYFIFVQVHIKDYDIIMYAY